MALPDSLQLKLTKAKASSLADKISIYEGFGSFHSENVQSLVELSDAEYTEPANFPLFARRILPNSFLEALGVFCCNRLPNAEEKDQSVGRQCEKDTGGVCVDHCTHAMHEVNRENSMRFTLSETVLSCLLKEGIPECPMGHEFGKRYFNIKPGITFLNHGAFGSSLCGAVAIKHRYEWKMETEAVEFFDRDVLTLLVHSIRQLAGFLGADRRQLAIVTNASFGLNCAMKLISKGDIVAFLDVEYISVYKMLLHRCQEVGATLHELFILEHLHNDTIMGNDAALTELICSQLPQGCTTMVIDYITSTSALCLPIFSHIIPALRRCGVHKIIVDGAHALLQVELNFNLLPQENQPTVFVGNFHKWFSAPKSLAFFWVHPDAMCSVHNIVVSHGFGNGFLSEFIWDGTRDYGVGLSIPALVDFWQSQGCGRVRRYCSNLLASAVSMLTKAFGSRKVARCSPFMSLIELPAVLQDGDLTCKYIQDLLHDTYGIEVPVKQIAGRHYIRISVFVYNTPHEYSYLRESVLSLLDKWTQLKSLR